MTACEAVTNQLRVQRPVHPITGLPPCVSCSHHAWGGLAFAFEGRGGDMKITAGKAIRIECGICLGKNRSTAPCQSKNCWLANGTIGSSLRKIKMHCRDCAPDHRVEDCTVWIIGSQALWLSEATGEPLDTAGKESSIRCVLYPFRYGKRPGGPTERQIANGKRLSALKAEALKKDRLDKDSEANLISTYQGRG